MIRELELEFQGKGEVKGFNFSQLRKGNKAYIYTVVTDGVVHYEVFERRIINKFDFINKIKLEDEIVSYPKSAQFGVSAWSFSDLNKADECYHRLENKTVKIVKGNVAENK